MANRLTGLSQRQLDTLQHIADHCRKVAGLVGRLPCAPSARLSLIAI